MSAPVLSKLLNCAKAIEDGDLNLADTFFKEIKHLTAIEENEATRKAVKYFAEALVRRAYKLHRRISLPLVPPDLVEYFINYEFNPFYRFADLTTHDPIVDALKGSRRVHIIDFSFMVSIYRYHHLMEDLANQPSGPPSFQLTTIGPRLSKNFDYLNPLHRKLNRDAKRLHMMDFQWNQIVATNVAGIVESALKLRRIDEDEKVVVKWEFQLHKLLAIPGAIEQVLSKMKELKPEVMLIVEQEAKHSDPQFLEWFDQSFQYYSSVFQSLEEDNFKDTWDDYKVLWEMYFRRQISSVAAKDGINTVERHEMFDKWEDRLRHAGFLPFRLWFNHLAGWLAEDAPLYMIKEQNLCPLLCRRNCALAVASAWKPDPDGNIVQDASPSLLIEHSMMATYSESHADEADDGHIMMEGNIWSKECTSINQIAASAEIFDILEYICHENKLPLALTWISEGRDNSKNSSGKQILHVDNIACYVNDLKIKNFVEACEQRHLEEGQGVAGKALLSNIHFIPDVSLLSIGDYPFVYDAWKFGFHAVLAVKLASTYMNNVDYILEFFLPPKMKGISEQKLLINEISTILLKNCKNSWTVCSVELGSVDIGTDVSTGVRGMSRVRAATISSNSPPESSEIAVSINSNQVREFWDVFTPNDNGAEVYTTHEQEVGEQNAIPEPAADVPENEVVSHWTTRANKRRRTSEVWKGFNEVRADTGEVWAICKGCNKKYRAESTRGTTNLRKHLRTCPGKRYRRSRA